MTDSVRIVSIQRLPRRNRLAVQLTDGSSFSVTPDVAARYRLAAGLSLVDHQIEAIITAQAHQDALAAALRLIAFRPRTEQEMRRALARRAVPETLREEIIARLRELGLINDASFAADFVESRDRTSPRSGRLLAQELRQKGIQRETAARSAETIDDRRAAYRAAEPRAGRMRGLEFADFERRLAAFLLRRGFSYETTRDTVRRLWKAVSNAPSNT